MKKKYTIFIPLATLLSGVGVFVLLSAAKEEIEAVEEPEPVVAVDVARVRLAEYRLEVPFFGRVEPLSEVNLVAEVSGRIVAVHPSLKEGGRVEAGEELFKIDDRDLLIRLSEEKAQLEFEKSQLEIEMGKARSARLSVEKYRKNSDDDSEDFSLALRKPQVSQQKAKVALQESRIAKAKLDLERSSVVAANDTVVLEEDVELGQYVSAGQVLGRLSSGYGFEIAARIPKDEMAKIRKLNAEGLVTLRDYSGVGRVASVLPEVDAVTGRAGLLLRFDALDDYQIPYFGSFVDGKIMGQTTEVWPLVSSTAIEEDQTIWIASEDGVLRQEHVELAASAGEYAFVSSGLEPGELFVVRESVPLYEGLRAEAVSEIEWGEM